MWSNLKNFSSVFLQCAALLTNSKRVGYKALRKSIALGHKNAIIQAFTFNDSFEIFQSTYILRRLREPKLNPLGSKRPRKLKRREYYYEVVENILTKKSPTIKVVLLKDVPGTGMAGDKIEINKYSAYKNLILPKLAVYATSPEALAEISEEKQFSSMFSKVVENYLASTSVPVFLSLDTKWSLEPWHIKVALRKIGISASDDCITLPSNKILGPNQEIENRDFLVQMTMNKSEKFDIRCRIFHWSQSDRTLNQKTVDMISPSEPLFPEQKKVIDKLIENEKEFKKSKNMRASPVHVKGKKKKFH